MKNLKLFENFTNDDYFKEISYDEFNKFPIDHIGLIPSTNEFRKIHRIFPNMDKYRQSGAGVSIILYSILQKPSFTITIFKHEDEWWRLRYHINDRGSGQYYKVIEDRHYLIDGMEGIEKFASLMDTL
jgi:hypothetical protein